MSRGENDIYEFGGFRLEPAERVLLKDGQPVALTPKAFDLLVCLVENTGRLLPREELLKAVWPDSVVEEANITVNISGLRKVLGDGPDGLPQIETVPKKGYRFRTAVKVATAPTPAAALDPAPLPVTPSTPREGPPRRVLPWAVAAAVLAVAIGGLLYASHHNLTAASHGAMAVRPALAVLPFRPLGEEGQDEYLGLGMADALITRLGGLRQVVVRPIAATRRYATSEVDPLGAGRDLGVQSVVDGTIQRDGQRLRITVRLVRIPDGSPIWAGEFDERFTDMFAVEDSISQKVTEALAPRLTAEERSQIARRYTERPEAHQLYLRGRFFWNKRTADAVQKAAEQFEEAVATDPSYALPHAGLADCYLLLGSPGYSRLPPREALPKAEAAAARALVLDDTLAEAHTSLAYAKLIYEWDWPGALQSFRRALELNPGYDTAHHWYSHYLTAMGRTAESLAASRRALELNPLDVALNEHLGWHYLMARQYDNAIAQCHRTLEMDSHFVVARRVLGLAELYAGRAAEATAEFERALEANPGDVVLRALLARAHARSGRGEEARRILRDLEKEAERRYVSPADLATIRVDLGERDAALRWLDRAYEERSAALINLRVDPAFDRLQADPAFQNLVRRVGLPR